MNGYTEKYILEEMTAEEVIKKWIMIKNKEHIETELQNRKDFYLHNTDQNANYTFTDVPFKNKIEKVKSFDRDRAWEEAPEYDLGKLKNMLNK